MCPPPRISPPSSMSHHTMMNDQYSQPPSCYSSPGYYMPMETKEPKREKRKYRCRKRSPAAIERAKTVRRDKANARERRRMNNLNDALEELRSILPQLPDEPKMTKIETLRWAQGYIKMMSEILSHDASMSPTSHCHSLSDRQSQYFDTFHNN